MNPADLTISVIIPLYNGARFVRQALDSVFQQTIAPNEIIVVDDGSIDDGAAIVSAYTNEHPVILLRQANAGQAAARNAGIRQSTGRLIALLDQDDIWYPHHLQALTQPFLTEQTNDLGWVYSDVDQINENNRLRLRAALATADNTHPKTRLDICLSEDMFVLPSASIITRSAFDTVGGFDERLCGYEDDDLFLRLFIAGYRNVFIDRPTGQWRVYAGSTSYSARMTTSRMIYARKLITMFPDEPRHLLFYTRDLIAPRFLHLAVDAARQALRSSDQAAIKTCSDDISFLRQHISVRSISNKNRKDLLISAVIPLYNGAIFIQEAIESVLSQTLAPDELIVVDDGSTDNGAELVMEMAKTHAIRLIRKENGGQSSARNVGVDHAHGDLIAFLDQDDVWYPNHLAELVQPFFDTGAIEVGWTYSDVDEVGKGGEMISRCFLGRMQMWHPKRDLMSCLRFDMFVLPSASLISRKAFLHIGGFDERLSGYEDDDLFLRLFQSGLDNIYIPVPLSKWRMHRSSSSYSVRMAVSRATYARMLIERFPDDPDTSRYYVRDLIAPRFFKLMTTEMRKAVIKGSKDQRKAALANLKFISGHLRLRLRLPVRLFVLPLLRVKPLAHLIMENRFALAGIARRFL